MVFPNHSPWRSPHTQPSNLNFLFRITDIAYEGLGEVGQLLGISTGELMERVGRSCKDNSKREHLLQLLEQTQIKKEI